MINNKKIVVVIPTFKALSTIQKVIDTVPEFVDHIVVVDDKCPQESGKHVLKLANNRVTVIFHEINIGVGGATISGYQKALDLGADVLVKIDSDGQMNPEIMGEILGPVLNEGYGYSKGNRFGSLRSLNTMPKIRLFGNSVLSFLVKVASGYWNIMDPTNGYTAIHREALKNFDLELIDKRFFFRI